MKTFLVLCFTGILSASADDWPRWMGEKADGVWREKGIRTDLPKSGAPVVWRVPVGWGYSGPAVAGGRVYVSDYQRSEGELVNNPGRAVTWQGIERLLCLNAVTGQEIWKYEESRTYTLSYPGGPRATPTIANGLVYFLGGMGDLVALDAETGAKKWERNFQKDFDAGLPIWGFSAHPLVVGDTLYCLVGGEGSVAVAFDAMTGEVKWKALDARSQGYCPPSLVKVGKTEQLLIWHPEAINSLNPKTGEKYWELPLKPIYGMSVMTPRLVGNKIFASGIGRVGAMIELDENEPTAKFIWRGKPKTALYCCNSTPLIHDGVIYGCDVRSSQLVAASVENGERFWSTIQPTVAEEHRSKGGSHGTAHLTRHEESGNYWIFNENGDLILAQLSRKGYREIGRQHVLEPTNEAYSRPVVWSGPAFAGKAAYLRNDKELVKVDLSAK